MNGEPTEPTEPTDLTESTEEVATDPEEPPEIDYSVSYEPTRPPQAAEEPAAIDYSVSYGSTQPASEPSQPDKEAEEESAMEEEAAVKEAGEADEEIGEAEVEEEEPEEDVVAPLAVEGEKPKKQMRGGRRRFSVALKPGEMEQFVQEIEIETREDDPDADESDGVERLTVVCPDGCSPGDPLYVTTPNGQEVEVVVPDGICPGAEFEVEVGLPAETPPTNVINDSDMDPIVLQELRDLGVEQ